MDTVRICPNCGKPLAADAPQDVCPECLMKAGLATEAEKQPNPKRRFVPPTVEELGRHFPQLEILSSVGQGGMGAVYKARQKELDRIVALKILPPGIGNDLSFAERFAREARALAKLNHPGIVTIHDFGRTDGLFYFVMEFVDGVNLRQLLAGGRVSPREALAIVPQICDALQYAHDHGIVHRDIKPENILLDRQGRVKVADFGLAKLVGVESGRAGSPLPAAGSQKEGGAHGVTRPTDAALTDADKIMGTPHYMAPEQMERPQEVDHRADIYSLGVVLYQMLTGELPDKRIEPPSKKIQVDVRIDEIVLRALERKPERRYQSAEQFGTMVETIWAEAGESGVRSLNPGVGQRQPASPGRFQWNLWSLVGSALGLSLWMPLAAIFSEWSGAGVALSDATALLILITAFVVWLQRQRLSALRGYMILLGAGFVATAIFLIGAHALGLTVRSSWPGGTQVSPLNWAWVLALFPLLALWFFKLERNARNISPPRSSGRESAQAEQMPGAKTGTPSSHPSTTDPDEVRLTYAVAVLIGLLIAVVWGYFSDLRNGQMGWFIGRIVVVTLGEVGLAWLFLRLTQPGRESATPNPPVNPWPKRLFWLIVALIVVPVFLLFVAVLVPWLAYVPTRAEKAEAEGTEAVLIASAPLAAFGPLREVILFELESSNDGPRFLDLDTGKTHGLPSTEHRSDEETRRWMTEQGLDLFAERIGDRWGFVTAKTHELELTRIHEGYDGWEIEITPEDLTRTLAQADRGLEVRDENGPQGWRGYFLPEPIPPGLSLAFKTASGAIGFLQISAVRGHSDSLRLHYKLALADVPVVNPNQSRFNAQRFGPVIERVVHDLDEGEGSEALDLITGDLSSIPGNAARDRDALEAWFGTNNMHLLADFAQNRWALMVKELSVVDIADRRWDEIQPEDIRKRLDAGPSALEMLERGGHRYYLLGEGARPPLLFAFQADTGDLGMMQIDGFNGNPRGLSLRYRLVQTSGTQVEESSALFGPEQAVASPVRQIQNHSKRITPTAVGTLVVLAFVAMAVLIGYAVWRLVSVSAGRHWRWAGVVLAIVLLGGTVLVWSQRPQQLDALSVSESPDGRYHVLASTWHAMRIFGGDRTTYRFTVRSQGEVIIRESVPVPYRMLSPDNMVHPPLHYSYYSFQNHGSIQWSEDSRRVSFFVRGTEIATLTVEGPHGDPAPAPAPASSENPADADYPASFGPVMERKLVGNESLINCFLDVETGRVLSAPKPLLDSLRAQGQLGPSKPQVMNIAGWARDNGVDFMLRSGESRLLLVEGLALPSARSLNAHSAPKVARFPGDADLMRAAASPGSHTACDFGSIETENRSWVFWTREGSRGVIEVNPLADQVNAVQVRYKLVTTEAASPSAARELSPTELEAAIAHITVVGTAFEGVETAIEHKDSATALRLVDEALEQAQPVMSLVQGTPLEMMCQTGIDRARQIREALVNTNLQEAAALTTSLQLLGGAVMDSLRGASERAPESGDPEPTEADPAGSSSEPGSLAAMAETPWGNPTQGLVVRLRPEKQNVSDNSGTARLNLDARNKGPYRHRIQLETVAVWLEVDGRWYQSAKEGDRASLDPRSSIILWPGLTRSTLGILLQAGGNPEWMGGYTSPDGKVPSPENRQTPLASQPLELTSGTHRVRIAFPPLDDDSIRLKLEAAAYSNPVEIEVLAEPDERR